ncbi:MAG: hypothetical protein QXS20_03625 [Candidatus Thorarchaeota archaeon]
MKTIFKVSLTVLPLTASLLALIALYALSVGAPELIRDLLLIVGPVCPLVVGTFGVLLFGRGALTSADILHFMCLTISLGLVVLTLPESATSIVTVTQDPHLFYFAVTLLQIPGVLLWTTGIVSYLLTLMRTLRPAQMPKSLVLLLVVTVATVIAERAILMVMTPRSDILETIVSIPVSVAVVTILLSLIVITWQFRGGVIAVPFAVLTLTLFIFVVRDLISVLVVLGPTDPTVRLLAVEAYLLAGVALIGFEQISPTYVQRVGTTTG